MRPQIFSPAAFLTNICQNICLLFLRESDYKKASFHGRGLWGLGMVRNQLLPQYLFADAPPDLDPNFRGKFDLTLGQKLSNFRAK